MTKSNNTSLGFLICLGLVILGTFAYCGIQQYSNSQRIVSVRGLSEREVAADRVLWPLAYSYTGYDLQKIYSELEKKNNIVVDFLVNAGIPKEDIIVNSASVVDLEADRYSSNDRNYRYIATQVITVNSSEVELVVSLQQRQNELLRQNIALLSNSYEYATNFIFTKLNDIKPEMIAEATQAARQSAQQFATDSDSEIGKIRTASQGQFSIADRDQYTPQIKNIRVVTYVTYEID